MEGPGEMHKQSAREAAIGEVAKENLSKRLEKSQDQINDMTRTGPEKAHNNPRACRRTNLGNDGISGDQISP